MSAIPCKLVGDGGIAIRDLNLRKGQDRAIVLRAIRDRFEISAEARQQVIDAAKGILDDPEADYRAKVGASKIVTEAARINAMLEALDQTDYWNADKNARLDAGLATERVGIAPSIVSLPVGAEPLPDERLLDAPGSNGVATGTDQDHK